MGFIKSLVAAAGLTAGIIWYHGSETDRNNLLPLMFSEKSQIHKDADANHAVVGPVTEYLTSTNDACMKIFECWDISMSKKSGESGNRDVLFAKELTGKMDPSNTKFRYNLQTLLTSLPVESEVALQSLGFRDMTAKAKESAVYFDGAWDYDRDDHHKYVTRTRLVTSNGKTHMETYQDRVYSYSTHKYTYHPESGEHADETLKLLIAAYPELSLENILVPSKTNAEGESAINTTVERDKDKPFTKADYLIFSSKWNIGSTLVKNFGEVKSNWEELPDDSKSWNNSKNSAASITYDTHSRSDSGPKEYQFAERTLDHLRSSYKSIDEIIAGMEFVKSSAPVLHQKIVQYVDLVNQNKGTGKLKTEIISLTKELYTKNFKGGADVDRFRWYMVFLGALLGLGAGLLLGSGVEYGTKKTILNTNFRKSFRGREQTLDDRVGDFDGVKSFNDSFSKRDIPYSYSVQKISKDKPLDVKPPYVDIPEDVPVVTPETNSEPVAVNTPVSTHTIAPVKEKRSWLSRLFSPGMPAPKTPFKKFSAIVKKKEEDKR